MKRFAFILCAALGVVVAAGQAQVRAGELAYGGQQPWWNFLNSHNRKLTCEEQRLNRFWHDYYDALRKYYKALDHIDWVAYYKNHGYQINGGGCAGPGGNGCMINYAPVVVNPGFQWAVPNGCMGGPPVGPVGPGCHN
ncbi:MAG: hypothetical protein JO112_17170 [Planctomycetes bacterium]|nr:hypothetical protein [Planctomycetota bacterium]